MFFSNIIKKGKQNSEIVEILSFGTMGILKSWKYCRSEQRESRNRGNAAVRNDGNPEIAEMLPSGTTGNLRFDRTYCLDKPKEYYCSCSRFSRNSLTCSWVLRVTAIRPLRVY